MPKAVPPLKSMALALLRQTAGWSQAELAEASGSSSGQVSHLEQGKPAPSRDKLTELAVMMGHDEGAIDLALLALQALVGPATAQKGSEDGTEGERGGGGAAGGLLPDDLSPHEHRLARQAAARQGLAMAALTETRMVDLLRQRRVAAARAEAERRWEEMKVLGSSERQVLVERLEEFRTWAVAERLATESAELAAKSAGAAVELARLAVRVAEVADIGEGFRSRLQGITRGFLTNGLRVAGRLREADGEMEAAKRLWSAGEDPRSVLAEWRLLDLEASLRREQGRFQEALQLLEQARELAPPEAVGRILVSKGFTLEQAGDTAGAVVALREAVPLVNAAGTPRDQFGLGFNLTVNLYHLGHFDEAEERLPVLRQLAQGMGNDLDLLKVQWLSGRVAAGLGRREEARRAFKQVRKDYEAGHNPLGAAVVSLDLAVLYLEEGRTAEVRTLAESMVRIFVTEGDEPEALIAVRLFAEAARQETATVEEARRLQAVLEKLADRKVRSMP